MTTTPTHRLPRPGGDLFLTDGGLETVLVFHDGIDLPAFAAFPLLLQDAGRRRLADYYRPYLRAALDVDAGFVLETPTWRANADWGRMLGYGADDLARINRLAVDLLLELRDGWTGSRPCPSAAASAHAETATSRRTPARPRRTPTTTPRRSRPSPPHPPIWSPP